MRKFYYCFALVAFTSCVSSIDYVGNSYQPTSAIDVYVDESAIKRKFDIVGKGYTNAMFNTKAAKVQAKAIEKAKEKGADAILIKDYIVPSTSVNTSIRTDSVNKGIVSVGNTTVSESSFNRFFVLFLKYKE